MSNLAPIASGQRLFPVDNALLRGGIHGGSQILRAAPEHAIALIVVGDGTERIPNSLPSGTEKISVSQRHESLFPFEPPRGADELRVEKLARPPVA